MPLSVKRIGRNQRIIEKQTGKVARNDSGKAIDGGGHRSLDAARRQIQAIKISQMDK